MFIYVERVSTRLYKHEGTHEFKKKKQKNSALPISTAELTEKKTETGSVILYALFLDKINQAFQVFRIDIGKYTVTEIENMT